MFGTARDYHVLYSPLIVSFACNSEDKLFDDYALGSRARNYKARGPEKETRGVSLTFLEALNKKKGEWLKCIGPWEVDEEVIEEFLERAE